MKWRIVGLDGKPIEVQPAEGFDGCGKAYLWLRERGMCERLGVDLFAVRDDGARPSISSKSERPFLAVAA